MLVVWVEEVVQYKSLALAGRQLPRRAKDSAMPFGEKEVVLGGRDSRGRQCEDAASVALPGAKLRPATVGHARAHILQCLLGLSERATAAVSPAEGILGRVLGRGPVAEHHDREAYQAHRMDLIQGCNRSRCVGPQLTRVGVRLERHRLT